MHPLNPYATKKPDFSALAEAYPDFAKYVKIGEDGYASIDFQNPAALRALTRCLLLEDWGLDVNLREDRICPTITNRLDYLFHVLDLEAYLPSTSSGRPMRVLDIGTGAVAIYPILLHQLRPQAQISATELDEISCTHAQNVLNKNDISSLAVHVFKAPSPEPILFPILDDEENWDVTICNPPFFGSEAEMKDGQDLKELAAHAAPTAAANELITPGGEVAFVGRMIEESMEIGQRCRWYTSLIGKFSSLAPLVDRLHRHQIDNYLLRSIQQGKTSRWILGWSHSSTRLPDSIARPDVIISNTSFSRLLPHPNSFTHRPEPAIPLATLRRSVLEVLKSISLDSSTGSATFIQGEEDAIIVSPITNTWSRAARRQAARRAMDVDAKASSSGEASTGQPRSQSASASPEPLLRAKIRFTTLDETSQLDMDWTEGRDRAAVDALWKFVLSKADLVRKGSSEEQGVNGAAGGGRGRGRGAGVSDHPNGSTNSYWSADGDRDWNWGRDRQRDPKRTDRPWRGGAVGGAGGGGPAQRPRQRMRFD